MPILAYEMECFRAWFIRTILQSKTWGCSMTMEVVAEMGKKVLFCAVDRCVDVYVHCDVRATFSLWQRLIQAIQHVNAHGLGHPSGVFGAAARLMPACRQDAAGRLRCAQGALN